MTPYPLTQAKLLTSSSSLAVSEEMREMTLVLPPKQTAKSALSHGARHARFTLKQRRNLCWRSSGALHTVEQEVALANDALRHV